MAHVTNTEVLGRMGQERMLLKRVKSRKLKYFGHVAIVQSLEHDLNVWTSTREKKARRTQDPCSVGWIRGLLWKFFYIWV